MNCFDSWVYNKFFHISGDWICKSFLEIVFVSLLVSYCLYLTKIKIKIENLIQNTNKQTKTHRNLDSIKSSHFIFA